MVFGYLTGVVICLFFIRKYKEYFWGVCSSSRRLDGKIVIITGANSGIGRETTRELAKRGAIVILACRNKVAAQEAIRDIRSTTADGDLIVVELDLANLSSVKKCAENLLRKFPRIDILVNNAGVVYPPDMGMKTADGYEIHFGVNHLGHFLLTKLLLDRVKETQNSRVVILSSTYYKKGKIDFRTIAKCQENPVSRPGHNPLYANSKLCNVLHGQELAKHLTGSSSSVFTLSPGFVYTGLFRNVVNRYSLLHKIAFLPLAFFTMRTAKQGAQTSVFCAVAEELEGIPFGHYSNCSPSELEVSARDSELATQLWKYSLDLLQPYF